jgi:hypothetical protein
LYIKIRRQDLKMLTQTRLRVFRLTFGALRNVTTTLTFGDAEHFRENTIPMAHIETLSISAWYHAHVAAAAFVAAAFLRARALQVVATSGSALYRRIVRGTLTDPLQLHTQWTTHSVLLFGLYQTVVHWRTGRFAGSVTAEERPRRVRYLQRLAHRTDCQQGLGLTATGHRWAR